MAGHSKWANIKHRKGAQDAKRGKAFTKAAKEIMLAAKIGGGDPDSNPRLRTAISAARSVNLPKDKIDTAIKKGTGELQAEALEEISYEGYGPGGVALLIEAATDNRNRTVAEVRHILSKHGGSMGAAGSVAWMFDRKGVIIFSKENFTEDQLFEVGIEAGAEDVIDEGDTFAVHTAVEDFAAVQQAFDAAEMQYENAALEMLPQNPAEVETDVAKRVMKVIDLLEDNDDVLNVFTNFEPSEEQLEELAG